MKRSGYCGGRAALGEARVRVLNVVFLLKQGVTPEQMLSVYPDPTLARVHGALVCYYDSVEEIEAELERDRAAARSSTSSPTPDDVPPPPVVSLSSQRTGRLLEATARL